jgi:ABC-2 type transport system permease protein
MNLLLLFVDELRGFYKSKVMIFLWIGLPVIALLFRFVTPASSPGQTIPFTVISALVVSSIGGTLASVMLAVFLINEKNRHVYDLFLIRPIKRRDILLAKFFSVYLCVAIAAAIAVFAGIITDFALTGSLATTELSNAGQSLATSLSMIAVACAAGVLIGVASPSVLVGAILVIYGGNQISVISLVPTLLGVQDAAVFTIGLAALVAFVLLFAAIALFERKQF